MAPRVRARLVCAHGGSRRRGHRRGRARRVAAAGSAKRAPRRRASRRRFSPLGPFSFSARKAREALAEHTMRAHRARLLVTCADALAKARNDDDENAARGRRTFVCFARRFGFFLGFRGAGLGFGSRESGDARGGVADEIGLPPPRATRSARRLSHARRPPPHKSSGTASRDRRSWSPCAGMTWSFASGSPPRPTAGRARRRSSRRRLKKIASGQRASSLAFSSRATRFWCASTPTLNGALVPAPLFRGGGDARDWSRVVVALRGDFGDARASPRARRRRLRFRGAVPEPTLARRSYEGSLLAS